MSASVIVIVLQQQQIGSAGATPPGYGWTRAQVIEIVKALAVEYEIPALALLTLGEAESGLRAHARRPIDPSQDRAYFPDVSFGWAQQTARWSREYAAAGYTGEYPGDAFMREMERLYSDPWHAGRVAAPQLKYYLAREDWDILRALSAYNKPNLPPEQNVNLANYQRGLEVARRILGE